MSSDDYSADTTTTGTLAAPSIDNATSVTANGDFSGDSDWFAVDLVAGNSYTFTTPSDFVSLNIYDNAQNLIGYNAVFTPANSATYYLAVNAYGDSSPYSVVATQYLDDYTNNAASTGTLAAPSLDNPSAVIGNVEVSGDSDWFAVDLQAGDKYVFNISTNTASYGLIYDANGVVGDFNYSFVPKTSGTYYAAVNNDSGTGDYKLSVSQYVDDYSANAATTGLLATPSLESSSAVKATFETADDSDWFAVNLQAGSSYSFTQSTADNATTLPTIYDSVGNVVSFNGVFTPVSSDTYYLSSNAYGSMGDYTLTAQQYLDDYSADSATTGTLATPSLDNPSAITANSEVSDDNDWFAVDLLAGNNYAFSSTGSTYIAAIYDTSNTLISYGNLFTPTDSATYYVNVNGYDKGDYTLSAQQYLDDYSADSTTTASITTPSLDNPSMAIGNIEVSGDTDWFAVKLEAGINYQFAAQRDDGTGYNPVTIYGSDGNWFSWSWGGISPSDSGTYYVAVSSYYDKGSYTLTGTQVDSVFTYYPYVLEGDFNGQVLKSETAQGVPAQIDAGAGDDTVYGNTGNDTLDGGAGADELLGGEGDDTYIVDNIADTVIEEMQTLSALDVVTSSVTYTLPANVENLTLTSTDNLNATGNALNNLIIGNAGNNVLHGLVGNDTLEGGAGNDVLYGFSGKDKLIGGTGDDVYYLNSNRDRVIETANAGVDSINSTVDYRLGAHVENLYLLKHATQGTGNARANKLMGNDGDNALQGMAGNDTLTGGEGKDLLTGGTGKDVYELAETTAMTDTVQIGAGDSWLTRHDKINDFMLGDGSTLVLADKLDLGAALIAEDMSAVNGIDAANIHSHHLTAGIITFASDDAYMAALDNNSLKLTNITDYLQNNINELNETVAFVWHDNTYVFTNNGDTAADSFVELTGVSATSLSYSGISADSLWLAV